MNKSLYRIARAAKCRVKVSHDLLVRSLLDAHTKQYWEFVLGTRDHIERGYFRLCAMWALHQFKDDGRAILLIQEMLVKSRTHKQHWRIIEKQFAINMILKAINKEALKTTIVKGSLALQLQSNLRFGRDCDLINNLEPRKFVDTLQDCLNLTLIEEGLEKSVRLTCRFHSQISPHVFHARVTCTAPWNSCGFPISVSLDVSRTGESIAWLEVQHGENSIRCINYERIIAEKLIAITYNLKELAKGTHWERSVPLSAYLVDIALIRMDHTISISIKELSTVALRLHKNNGFESYGRLDTAARKYFESQYFQSFLGNVTLLPSPDMVMNEYEKLLLDLEAEKETSKTG